MVRQPPFTFIWANCLTKLCGGNFAPPSTSGGVARLVARSARRRYHPRSPSDRSDSIDLSDVPGSEKIFRGAYSTGSRKDVLASQQDPTVSILLCKSAAAESRDDGDILTLKRGHSKGLSALQKIAGSLADQWTTQGFVLGHSAEIWHLGQRKSLVHGDRAGQQQ